MACNSHYSSGSLSHGKLVWSEEFDADGLPSSDRWDYEIGNKQHELQYYTNANATVKNSCLVIETRRESKEGFDYTSARLQSKQSFRYGVFEVRAKIPRGRGTWPAIWLRCAQRPYKWPNLGEIDIMEHIGCNPGYIRASLHCLKHNSRKPGNEQTHGDTFVKNIHDEFHLYALEWTPTKLTFFVDGHPYYSYQKYENSTESWPFDNDFNVVLNNAVGGRWAGAKGVDDSVFPVNFVVDYVRYYELADHNGHCTRRI